MKLGLRSIARLGRPLRLQRGPPEGKQPIEPLPPDFTSDERDIFESVRPLSMTSPERIVSLIRAVEYIERAQVPGAIVECGVWRGGSMIAVARTLMRLESSGRQLYLFDTFEGMPPPTSHDVSYSGEDAASLLRTHVRDRNDPIHALAPLDEVQQNLRGTGYDSSAIHYVRGRVEDTLPRDDPRQICLLRLDTDWYESTRHELIHLFPLLSSGGILIVDDYGHWQGAKKAVDEYFAELHIDVFLSRVDYTCRLAVKR